MPDPKRVGTTGVGSVSPFERDVASLSAGLKVNTFGLGHNVSVIISRP